MDRGRRDESVGRLLGRTGPDGTTCGGVWVDRGRMGVPGRVTKTLPPSGITRLSLLRPVLSVLTVPPLIVPLSFFDRPERVLHRSLRRDSSGAKLPDPLLVITG